MFRIVFALLISLPLCAVPIDSLCEAFPDDYVWKGKSETADVMLCLHGFGMDKSIGDFLHSTETVPHHLVAFNFPDYGLDIDITKPEALCFGTVAELRPVMERLHTLVNKLSVERVHLYGFSAGGGCAVNVLAALKHHRFQEELGLSTEQMDQIFAAIERGSVILDCPLKSIDEIIDEREPDNLYLKKTAQIYQENDLRPIDSLVKLAGSKLNVLLVLMDPDDVLSNRDDALFIERLKLANCLGKTVAVQGWEGLHLPVMTSLIDGYMRLIEGN